jgi:hypothetical protein
MAPPAHIERDKNHRFPSEITGHGVWLSSRFTPSYRDGQELLLEHGICAQRRRPAMKCAIDSRVGPRSQARSELPKTQGGPE